MSRPIAIFKHWLPLAAIITALCALAYVMVQQGLRMGANDPQIQMAEDTAASLDCCWTPEGMAAPKEQVNIAASLAPFFDVYDTSGKPVAGSGVLDGKLPDYPLGALQSSKPIGENRVTWQPEPGVRVASVVVPYKDGYVVAGRSLREVENREAQAELLAAVGWMATMVAALAAVAFGEYVLRSR